MGSIGNRIGCQVLFRQLRSESFLPSKFDFTIYFAVYRLLRLLYFIFIASVEHTYKGVGATEYLTYKKCHLSDHKAPNHATRIPEAFALFSSVCPNGKTKDQPNL